VISSGTYDLMQPIDPSNRTDVINAFECNFAYIDLPSSDATQMYDSENNKESVWEIQYNDERPQNPYLPGWLSTGNLLTQYYSPHLNSFKNHEVNPSLYYAFEDVTGHPAGFSKDPRLYGTLYMDGDLMDFRDVDGDGNPSEYTIPYVTGTNNKAVAKNRGLNRPGQPSEGFGLKKYHYPTYQEGVSPLCSPVNVRYIRFSDVLLLYAEASMLADNDADGTGLAALNRVRARVGMPPKAALTPQVIMNEREYELSLEGHRFLDLVRWSFDPQFGIDWNTLDWGLPYNPFTVGKNEYLPLPQGEIDVNNGALEQNPGW
jgi:hypothetical protein